MSGLYGHKGPTDGEEFDVVVVGAGSAGCALAGRLTEDPTLRVLLLEAGGSDDVLEVQIPAGSYKTWRTRLDWNYTTEPPASSSSTRRVGSSVSRPASAQPADPAPTTTTSNSSCSGSLTGGARGSSP